MLELPYQPIVFIKTAIIGGNNSNSQEPSHQYDFSHHHIVIPKYINNPNIAFYIIFHTPSLYNWLRTVPCRQSTLLASYLSQKSITSDLFPKVEINHQNIISSLQQYIARWEVAKLTFSSTFYISKVKQNGPRSCLHLPKTEQKSCLLTYSSINKKITCESIRCKQCNRKIEVESQLKVHAPNFVIYKDKYNKVIPLEVNVDSKKYGVYIVYGKNDVKVKGANQIWYQIDQFKIKTIPQQQIDLKNAVLAIFQKQQVKTIQLSIPPPLAIDEPMQKATKQQKMIEEQEEKPLKNKQQMTKAPNNKHEKDQQQSNFGRIKQLRFQPNKVLVKQDPKNKQYVESVQKQFLAPKEKDQYELDYDRGKLKKKKEKRHFIQPNYDEIQKQIKNRQMQMLGKESKKIKKKELRKKKQNIKGLDSDSN